MYIYEHAATDFVNRISVGANEFYISFNFFIGSVNTFNISVLELS